MVDSLSQIKIKLDEVKNLLKQNRDNYNGDNLDQVILVKFEILKIKAHILDLKIAEMEAEDADIGE